MLGKVKELLLQKDHLQHGAKMHLFCDWQMPLYYTSIVEEAKATRTSLGLFDVSHMMYLHVSGEKALPFLDYLSTCNIREKPKGSATYTLFLNERGGVIDDAIIYKRNERDFFIISNACAKERLFAHFRTHSHLFPSLSLKEMNLQIYSIQGPEASKVIKKCFRLKTVPKHHCFVEWKDPKLGPLSLAATGYTGESGFEIIVHPPYGQLVYSELYAAAEEAGGKAAGLGARDILRLEMGYPLSGVDWNGEVLGTETHAAWCIRFSKGNFVGREALLKKTVRFFPCALLMEDVKGMARTGDSILSDGAPIGRITSGNFSPVLAKPIALAFSTQPLEEGTKIEVEKRGNKAPATIVKIPFIKK